MARPSPGHLMATSHFTLHRIRNPGAAVYEHLQDYWVIEDDEPIGRICERRSKQDSATPWVWSITSIRNFAGRPTVKTNGHATSLDDAKQAFREHWEKLKAWQPTR
jgi:hypothetical protein